MRKFFFLFVLLTVYALNSSATIYYVTPSGNDNSSGLSWATARRTINSALDSAVIGDSIFVAVGEYAGFYPRNGVHIFGGFTGVETSLAQRQHLTFGYLPNGLATKIVSNIMASSDSYRIYCYSEATVTTVINGIVLPKSTYRPYMTVFLRGKYALENCSVSEVNPLANCVIYSTSGNPTFSNIKFTNCDGVALGLMNFSYANIDSCVFVNCTNNILEFTGANNNSLLNITNCKIIDHLSDRYGLVSCSKGSATMEKCIISNNNFYKTKNYGLFTWSSGGYLSLNNCLINNNYCADSTSLDSTLSIFNIQNNSTLIMKNCLIANNTVQNKYNASNHNSSILFNAGSANSIIQNCTFANNKTIVANQSSKAFVVRSKNAVKLYNDIFWKNESSTSAAQINGSINSTFTLYNAAMQQNLNGTCNIVLDSLNTGTDNTKNYVRFVRPTTFAGAATNSADSLAIMQADWHLDSGSACIDAGHPYQISLPYQDSLDLDGNHRVSGGRIDIGAYEYPQADVPQQILWSQNLQGKRLSEGFVVATATATSGLPVTYTSGNPRVATVSHDTIFLLSRGNATITATQWGDSVYMPATPLGKMLTVLDTIGVYDTIPVYDTVRSYDTIHVYDTLWHNDTIRTQVFDTLWTNDTIWYNDTTHTQVFDTTWTHLFDTIPVYDTTTIYIYDTIHIIDTIHIYDTTHVSIQGAEAMPWKIGQSGLNIIVSGAEGETVKVYDVSGRCLHVQPRAVGVLRFRMPTAGVYLVQVGGSPAQRIVLAVRE